MAHRDCERAARQLKKAIGKNVRVLGTGPNAGRVGTLVRVGSARVWVQLSTSYLPVPFAAWTVEEVK